MTRFRVTGRTPHLLARFGGLLAALAALALPAQAQPVVKVDTIRSPSYEILLKRMATAVPGVKGTPTMLTVDKLIELYTIRLSARSDSLDLMYVNDGILRQYAKNGWLRYKIPGVADSGKQYTPNTASKTSTTIKSKSYRFWDSWDWSVPSTQFSCGYNWW